MAGKVNAEWLETLLSHPYIGKEPPKSTGREDFGENYFSELLSEIKPESEGDKIDFVATLTRFTAESIYLNFKTFVGNDSGISELIASGGGTNNRALMDNLRSLFSDIKVNKIDDYDISADAKEALGFAIFVNEFVMGNSANVPSVTGASKRVVLGKLTI